MCANYNSREKDPIQQFFYAPQNITDEEVEDKITHDLQSVETISLSTNLMIQQFEQNIRNIWT